MNEQTSADRPTNENIAAFYDDFSQGLLCDYVKGNPRVAKALETVETQIDRSVSRILDIGCGVGASSFRFKSGRDWLTVQGVDISPKNVMTASRLFVLPGLEFTLSDMSEVPAGGPFDLIVMLDVYEHIPCEKRPKFHCVLHESLAPGGRVVITTPTYLHQEYLAENHPEGLQVVDETVRLVDFAALACHLGGAIVRFEMVSVWHTHDYAHVVIARAPKFTPLPRRRSVFGSIKRKLWWSPDGHPLSRRLRVRRRLSLDVK